MSRKIENSFSQEFAVSRSSRKIRNIIMALSSKTLILIICGLEITWYLYGICISWIGIFNAYYLFVMRMTPNWGWSDIKSYCIGLIVYVLSSWSTMALFFVAITDGEFSGKFVKVLSDHH